MDFTNKTKKELLELYKQAKEAYYTGEEIMSDLEFDELENFLGLSNKSSIGTRRNEKYVIKHPVLMGSLGKVQVKENKDGIVDWEQIYNDTMAIIKKKKAKSFVITPKFDGLSFEAVIENNQIKTISSRGDGEYGQNWDSHLLSKIRRNTIPHLDKYILRGEVLVDKNVFMKKYSDKYANPRSFVSGVMNSDYITEDWYQDMIKDIDIVIYDIRVNEDGVYVDKDWMGYTGTMGINDFPTFSIEIDNIDLDAFKNIYDQFSDYRKNCNYALDGYVIKPTDEYRISDPKAVRPKDCVAIKFMPMLNETEVIDIEWKLGKTGEYIPTIITNPVEMDGKMISRASGSNYGKLIDNKISIGTKVILSLAGDIIPFIYKITNTDNYSIDNLNLPTEHDTYVDDCHLYAILSDDDFNRNKFMASVSALNINHIGQATGKQILEYVTRDNGLTDDFFGEVSTKEIPSNILLVSSDDIYFGSGAGKTGDNAKKAFNDMLDQLRLVEIIKSCSFKFCGPKVAEQIEKYLLGQSYDFTSMASEGYEWAFDKNSKNYKEIEHIVSSLGKTFDDFKERIVEEVVSSEDKIPVILTGEPNDYASKAEFIRLNPQYRVTGKWTEVQIVFTNSLESNTGKMKRAKEKNIEIRLY